MKKSNVDAKIVIFTQTAKKKIQKCAKIYTF